MRSDDVARGREDVKMRPPLAPRQRRSPGAGLLLRQSRCRAAPAAAMRRGGHRRDPASLRRAVGEGPRVERDTEQDDQRLQNEIGERQIVQVEPDPVGRAEQPLVRREEVGRPVEEPGGEDRPAARAPEDDRVQRGRGERAGEQPGQVVRVQRHRRPAAPDPEHESPASPARSGEDERHQRDARLARLQCQRDGGVAGVHVSAAGGCASRRS